MKAMLVVTCGLAAIFVSTTALFGADIKPVRDGRFIGRIAYSADGNHNDRDDWAASPVALAILAESGLKDHLIHFDYNCILTQTNPEWEKIHAQSVHGAAEKYGFDKGLFHDCRRGLEEALDSIAGAINESSAENPLYFIIAGPMEVPYLGIQRSKPEKRKFTYCISHSRWNDGFASTYTFTHTKRSVIEQGVNWLQIRDQNRLLSLSPYGRPAKPEEFGGFFWMRDSQDPKVQFLWERIVVSTRPDPSDAGMAYFLATGDEDCDPVKLRRLLDGHQRSVPLASRKQVRLEVENFRYLINCRVEERNDKNVSHRLSVVLTGTTGSIRTRFEEPYAAREGRYSVDIRYFDDAKRTTHFSLWVKNMVQGSPWVSRGENRGWMTETIHEVPIALGDEIKIELEGEPGRLDYVQLNSSNGSP